MNKNIPPLLKKLALYIELYELGENVRSECEYTARELERELGKGCFYFGE